MLRRDAPGTQTPESESATVYQVGLWFDDEIYENPL